jgi:hypothetical protein
MIAVPVFMALIGCPQIVDLLPYQILVGEDCVAIQLNPGEGPGTKLGERITVDFSLRDPRDAVLADTNLRGLPFSFPYGSAQADAMLNAAAEGMRPGEERIALFDQNFTLPAFAPAHTAFDLWIRRA